jgi:hypothetical protein
LWLKLWLNATNGDRVTIQPNNNAGNTGWVKATVYPYYLTREAAKYKFPIKLNRLGAFKPDPTLPAIQAYQGSLQTMLNGIPAATSDSNILGGYKTAPSKPTYIATLVAKAWGPLSDVSHTSAAAGASSFSVDTFAPITAEKRVEYIWTACRPVDESRRNASDRLIDGFSLALTTEVIDDAGKADILLKLRSTQAASRPATVAPKKTKASTAASSAALMLPFRLRSKMKAAGLAAGTYNQGPSSAAGARNRVNGLETKQAETKGNKKKLQVTAHPNDTSLQMSLSISDQTSSHPVSMDQPPQPTSSFYLTPDFAAQFLTSSGSPFVIYQLPSGGGSAYDPFSTFISDLDLPAIHVEASGSLSADEDLRQWLPLTALVQPDTAGVNVSIQVGGTQASATVQSFAMTLPSTNTNAAMNFSTSTLTGNFSNRSGPDPTLPVGFTGYFPFQNFLLLGLDPSSKGNKADPNPATSWQLSQIFQQINVETGLTNSGAVVLEALLGVFQNLFSAKLFLQRGMIWFVPDENYLTIQRLEWGLEDSAEQSLTNWVHEWLQWDIAVHNISIVTRRECTRLVTGDSWKLVYNHELLVMFGLTRTKDGDPSKAPLITCGLDFNCGTGSSSLTGTLRIDPSTGAADDGILDFLEWLVPSATTEFSAIQNIIPVINNIKLRSVSVTISKSDAGIAVNRVMVNAEYSDPTWTVSGDNGSTTVVPLLVSSLNQIFR